MDLGPRNISTMRDVLYSERFFFVRAEVPLYSQLPVNGH